MRRPDSDPSATDRAQAFTLEAVVASVIVLVALLFALQVAGVTALSASTSSGQVLDQQEAVAAGVLDRAAANGTLRPMLLYWNKSDGFHGTKVGDDDYTSPPPTAFGDLLEETLDDRDVAFNVDVRYVDGDRVKRRPVVRYGEPSDDAARATRTVTLYDDDRLLFANGTRTDTTLADVSSSFYAPDRYAGPVYNVVRVEVVVWRV